MASVVRITFDMGVVLNVLGRLHRLPETAELFRHLEALVRDDAAFEVQAAPAGTGCTHRIVPSIQLLRLLEQHEARV